MSLQAGIALLLAGAVLLASARFALRWFRVGTLVRPQAWRAAFLLGAQAASAVLLWFALFPPLVPVAPEKLMVLTADAGKVETARIGASPGSDVVAGSRVVALPEAARLPAHWRGAERVPDLATALRRYPGTRTLEVVGMGLEARDRSAASGLALDFEPAPIPRGLVGLDAPASVAPGRGFVVAGRTHALAGGSAELLDPAGKRAARTVLDDSGAFVLHASVRDAGLARFRLRLRDAGGPMVEDVPIPVLVLPEPPMRALLLAGAPNAELKFLRRWADDAGIAMEARIELGAGLQIGDAPRTLDAATLDRLDLLLVDERSWRGLGRAQRSAVLAAVDRGLGLLLRISASIGSGDRASLQALGFTAANAVRRETRLGTGFVRPGDAADALPTLTRSPVEVGTGVVALADAAGRPLARWRAHGRGRIGVGAFDDSYRLALAGRGDAHGEAWSRIISAVARPGNTAVSPKIDVAPPGQRSTLCGLAPTAEIRAPDGRTTRLLVDPRSGGSRCAGYWAHATGRHLLRSGGLETGFEVAAAEALPAMRARAVRDATLALTGPAPPAVAAPPAAIGGPRWPWFLGWLLLTTTMWWLERSRRGLRVVSGDTARNDLG
jgi:hypothetical protein